jgi:twitching motility protein PilJ
LQDELSSISTLMERAEKSGLILGQQKTLTQVGDALRTINRQSSDLLETAETISSLKLQQGAGAAEISAAGQLVMLTQRIAKSANEFQTLEGVSPSRFPAGQGLELLQGNLRRPAQRQRRNAAVGGTRSPGA